MTQISTLNRRSVLALGAATATSAWTAGQSIAKSKSPVLVELFTSQGCSSCPPADALALKLAARDDVFVLSYNVDYWDYLGWRDTLAKPEFSQRQYDYAHSRGDGSVYTPQMIFNGTSHAVGSKASAVEKAIASAPPVSVDISLSVTSKEIIVTMPAQSDVSEATLWLMSVAPRKTQIIERGENAGETITYVNVVRNMVPAAMWSGEAYTGKWMHDAVMTPESKTCMAILQMGKAGPVLGMARV